MVEKFDKLLNTLGLKLSPTQKEQFEVYYTVLLEWNERINLTSITEKEDVYLKHFFDSLTLIKSVRFDNQTILDVGSGAGFPSIPLKIAFPGLKITIVDSLKKRVDFLEYLSKRLNIQIELKHGRIENQTKFNYFDIVTARAVASLPILCELFLPFVKVNGYFLAMKSTKADTELIQSIKAIETLKGEYLETIHFTVEEEHRAIIKVIKTGLNPNGYPRKYKQIKNKPIV